MNLNDIAKLHEIESIDLQTRLTIAINKITDLMRMHEEAITHLEQRAKDDTAAMDALFDTLIKVEETERERIANELGMNKQQAAAKLPGE